MECEPFRRLPIETPADSSPASSDPRVVPLQLADDPAFGGKARGLARVIKMGLPVPSGFVVVDATPDRLPEDLGEHYEILGAGPVAVRSSALGEDSADASFAGQYETLLDVEGEEALAAAIVRCLESHSSRRAESYAEARGGRPDGGMCVVVQRMVEPRAAGVLFTADPVSGRRSRTVIDAVAGLGEALVSGHASPDHYVLDRSGHTLMEELEGGAPVLEPEDRAALAEAARAVEAKEGIPLDLEWAIDRQERIYWLQARPITNLGADPTELDTPLLAPDHVYTRCNVGEMFPGACTPLSFSFTARSIDVGMQRMHQRIGIQGEVTDRFVFIGMFHGNLFLNLTTMAAVATQALGSSADQMALSICGRPITELDIKAPAPPPLPRRIANGTRYVRYLLGQRRARRRLRALCRDLRFSPSETNDPRELWQAIDERFDAIFDAMDLHLISSAGSGVLTTTLLAVLAGGETPTDAHHALVAGLLAGAEGVESADIVAGAERLRDAVASHPEGFARVAESSPEDALGWLSGSESGAAGEAFAAYLERHGHRTVKELELRQAEWAEDPMPVVRSLRAALRGSLRQRSEQEPESTDPDEQEAAPRHGIGIRLLTRMARQAARSREETKSGLVLVTTRFKQAYRELARAMVDAALLPDTDCVFFLTHEELGRLASGDSGEEKELAVLAVARREVHPRQDELRFADVFAGAGEPEPPLPPEPGATRVTGAPVSRGLVEGIARVVARLEDAEALEQGEILIAPITDVGWTPYFSIVAGLVTDVGSAVSHGAVVAREYGLPAVVNTRNATAVFRTGDRVRLDGENGIVERIDPATTG
jgi:phosphohistidine swiveling domain-containing protein